MEQEEIYRYLARSFPVWERLNAREQAGLAEHLSLIHIWDFVAIEQSMKQINDSINNTLSQISMAVDQMCIRDRFGPQC